MKPKTSLFTHGYAIQAGKRKMNSEKGKGEEKTVERERKEEYKNTKTRNAGNVW
jgi:hypothetical protein